MSKKSDKLGYRVNERGSEGLRSVVSPGFDPIWGTKLGLNENKLSQKNSIKYIHVSTTKLQQLLPHNVRLSLLKILVTVKSLCNFRVN